VAAISPTLQFQQSGRPEAAVWPVGVARSDQS